RTSCSDLPTILPEVALAERPPSTSTYRPCSSTTNTGAGSACRMAPSVVLSGSLGSMLNPCGRECRCAMAGGQHCLVDLPEQGLSGGYRERISGPGGRGRDRPPAGPALVAVPPGAAAGERTIRWRCLCCWQSD